MLSKIEWIRKEELEGGGRINKEGRKDRKGRKVKWMSNESTKGWISMEGRKDWKGKEGLMIERGKYTRMN